jgi:hypothetical protein
MASPPRLDLLGESPPVGPSEDPSTNPQNQGTKRRTWQARSRICLLKGCGRKFRPDRPWARYCSEHCREQARIWRQWKARRQYRQSEHGRQKRQAQSRRYRVRQKLRKKQKRAPRSRREGHRKRFIFGAHATALGVMTSSSAAGGHPCSGSVPMRAGGLWNGFWSGRDVGENAAPPDHKDPTI